MDNAARGDSFTVTGFYWENGKFYHQYSNRSPISILQPAEIVLIAEQAIYTHPSCSMKLPTK